MKVKIKNLIESVSDTFQFTANKVHFLNTGDILDGKIINDKIYNIEELKGQAKKSIRNGDILYSEIRPKNRHFALVTLKNPEDYVVSTKLMVLRKKSDEVDLKYLYYLLTNNAFLNILQMRAENRICSFPQITFDVLGEYEFDIPNLEKQRKIASILSEIDMQLERNNMMVHKLQVLAQTTYSRWFNQFEFPNEDGLPYKSSGGKMVWNDELKREIPEDWNVDEVLNLINWQSSSQPPKSDFSSEMQDGYIRFIQNRDYDSDTHIIYIPIATNTKTCTQYDIMIDKYGDAGRTRYGLCGAYNVALAKIEPIFNNYQEYLRKYFEQEHIYRFLHKACIASTRASLNENILSGLTIVIPDDKILALFENAQKGIINQILSIQKENNHLQSLKNSILPLLINGQLNI